MRFVKMQGIGNDYIYVDCVNNPLPADPVELARKISDRHFGVGGDGLILICPSQKADARMRMFNADGSESEMCGNGLRCLAKFVFDQGIARKQEMAIETGRGVLQVSLTVENGKATAARIDMGEPIFDPGLIPTTLVGAPPKETQLQVAGKTFLVTCISMGNPHCVIFVDHITDELVLGIGPKIEVHPAFPRKTNVEFVQVNNLGEITMRVWERGSGETLACGTGACAAAVASALTGRTNRSLLVKLRGGNLHLDWQESTNHVFMAGSAAEVFQGEWPG
ncbi:MAG: diaminopimelate epimerase [Gemmataceae bacterium]|nr:diaminopimelate epimerase [Gemmataceae bacterium]